VNNEKDLHMHTEFELAPPSTSLTVHERLGFELGWDYAHYNVAPPAACVQDPSPVLQGLKAGQATFGQRTLQPTRHVRKWLQLRLHAWLRGRSVELVQVTPNYLQQIDVAFCPITRAELSHATMENSDASVDRVRSDAGYAAGNLAVMSAKANHAKGARGFREAWQIAQGLDAATEAGVGPVGRHGLTAPQWARVALLCSYVEALPHEEAAKLPMLVLPPNRLRLFNPVQALQAFVSQQLLVPGWSHRIARFEELLPGKETRRAFQVFFHALLPRVLEAGRTVTPHELTWAIEDAWRNPLAQARWAIFAARLTAAQCEALVARAGAKQLGARRLSQLDATQATDGWNLDSRGYVPHAVLMRRSATRRPVHPIAPAGFQAQAVLPLH
jgi:hypothetical protein